MDIAEKNYPIFSSAVFSGPLPFALLNLSVFFYEVNVDCFVVNVHTYHLDMGDLSKNIHYGQLLWHVVAAGKKEFIVNGKLYNVLHMFKMLFKP